MKKILIPLVLLALGGAAFAGYYFYSPRPAPLPQDYDLPGNDLDIAPNVSGNDSYAGDSLGTLTGSQNEVVQKIADGVGGYGFTDKGIVIIDKEAKVTLKEGGKETVLATPGLKDVTTVDFSFEGEKILVVSGRGNLSYFDITSKTWRNLPAGAWGASWSPIDQRLAYLTRNTDGSVALRIMDTQKGTATTVYSLYIEDLTTKWVSAQNIILSERPSRFQNGSIFSFNLQKRTLAPLLIDTPGLYGLWNSTSGLVFSAGSRGGGSLRLFDIPKGSASVMTFLTLPEKCSFAVSELYCAVPKKLEFREEYLPDDYLKKAFFTEDGFYRINLVSGDIKTVFAAQYGIDAVSLSVRDGQLYFLNRYDSALYAIKL